MPKSPRKHSFCVAPMIDWTDRHCRFFHRQISRHAFLYSEMITAAAILRGDTGRLLGFEKAEHPLALQLGGADPQDLASAARIGEEFGYDEINFNVGCPSDKVQNGHFGACLMASPALVAECMAAMREAVAIPVTIKHRLGIDEQDTNETLDKFVETVARSGCRTFIVHARKAWLEGLDPKQNREIPPLDYARVYRLKADFPQLEFILNGGLVSLRDASAPLAHVDGVMLGRAAYHDPYLLSGVDAACFGSAAAAPARRDVVEKMMIYTREQLDRGARLHHITRHMLGLYHARPGARAWRRHISENAHLPGASEKVLGEALEIVESCAANSAP